MSSCYLLKDTDVQTSQNKIERINLWAVCKRELLLIKY